MAGVTAEADSVPLLRDTSLFSGRYEWGYRHGIADPARAARSQIASVELGTTIPCMRAAAVVLLLTQAGVGLLALTSARCEGSAATYPGWIWAALLPALLCKGCAEWHATKYVAAISASRLPFKVLTRRTGYLVWAAFYGGLSLLNVADVGSDSLFAGTTFMSFSCPGSKLQERWQSEWEKSLLARAPAPHLTLLVGGFWLLSLVQLVWPMIRTLGEGPVQERSDGARYRAALLPCFGDDYALVFQDDAFFAAADAAGMAVIGGCVIPFSGDMVRDSAARAGAEGGDPGGYTLALSRAVALRREILERVLLSYIGENAIQLNLQSTLYALTMSLGQTYGWAQAQALFSLVIGLIASLLKLVEAKDVYDATHDLFDDVKRRGYGPDDDFDDYHRQQGLVRSLQRLGVDIGGACAILVATLLYAAAKVVMAHVCEHSLWNITGCAA